MNGDKIAEQLGVGSGVSVDIKLAPPILASPKNAIAYEPFSVDECVPSWVDGKGPFYRGGVIDTPTESDIENAKREAKSKVDYANELVEFPESDVTIPSIIQMDQPDWQNRLEDTYEKAGIVLVATSDGSDEGLSEKAKGVLKTKIKSDERKQQKAWLDKLLQAKEISQEDYDKEIVANDTDREDQTSPFGGLDFTQVVDGKPRNMSVYYSPQEWRVMEIVPQGVWKSDASNIKTAQESGLKQVDVGEIWSPLLYAQAMAGKPHQHSSVLLVKKMEKFVY